MFKNFSIQLTFLGGPTHDASDRIKTLTRKYDWDHEGSIEYVVVKPGEFLPKGYDPEKCKYQEKKKKLVYVCHGVGRGLDKTSIERWGWNATMNNVDIVVHNYPGYGKTSGLRTEKQICDDSLYLLRHLREEYEEKYKEEHGEEYKEYGFNLHIVLLGNSIGCGPVAWLAAHDEAKDLGIEKVILISPWVSLLKLWPTLLPDLWLPLANAKKSEQLSILQHAWNLVLLFPRFLLWILTLLCSLFAGLDFFDNFQSIKSVKKLKEKKVLMIHGNLDKLVPLWHSEKLIDAIGNNQKVTKQLVVMEKCGHVYTRLVADELIWGFVHDVDKDTLNGLAEMVKVQPEPGSQEKGSHTSQVIPTILIKDTARGSHIKD